MNSRSVNYRVAKLIKAFKVWRASMISLENTDYFVPNLIFAQNVIMEVKRNSRGLYWILFFISTVALVFAIASHWPWLTLILPFVTTFFVLAMDII